MQSLKAGTNIGFVNREGKLMKLQLDSFIASGGQAEIYTAHNIESPEEKLAVKYLSGAHLNAKGCSEEMQRKLLGFMKLSDDVIPKEFVMPRGVSAVYPGGGVMYAMTFLNGFKSLAPMIISPDKYDASLKFRIAVGVARAFQKLSNINATYGDISSANILYRVDRDGDLRLRIIDAEGMFPNKLAKGKRKYWIAGTGLYRAPEIINGALPDAQTDIHAFSVLAFRLFCGRHPLDGERVRNETFTEEVFKKYFCDDPQFIFRMEFNADGSVKGFVPNGVLPKAVVDRFNALPKGLKVFFAINFSNDALLRRKERLGYDVFLKACGIG